MIQHPMRFSPLVRRAFALAVAAATLASSPLAAQEPTAIPATHTVKKGDTLWDIAKMYLNDPFLWPEIYRLNTAIVEDPHWIYPGEVLTLPGGTPQVAENPRRRRTGRLGGPDGAAGRADRGSAAPAGRAPRSSRRPIASAPSARRASAARPTPTSTRRCARRVLLGAVARFVGTVPPNTGRIIRTANVPGEVRGVQRDKFNINDYVFVTLPKGVVAAKGDQFLVFDRRARTSATGRQVMRPTGR